MIIGNLGTKQRADVGAGGTVRLVGGIEIEWWVRAGERWQTPANEISVRDALLAFAPVLKTSLRVPGGDVITNVYATVQGQRELVVFDITNQSSAPVAIGFVVRLLTNPQNSSTIDCDGSVVRVGARPVLYLPGAPVDRFDGPPSDESAVRESATRESAMREYSAMREHNDGTTEASATGATFVVPLLHRSNLRAAALLGVSSAVAAASSPVLSAMPDADMVARGWALQAGEAARIDGDDARNGRLRSLASATLLYLEPVRSGAMAGSDLLDRANLARALVAVGSHDDALALLSGVEDLQGRRGELGPIDDPAVTASLVSAVVTVARHHPDATYAAAMVPMLSGALEYLLRSAKSSPAVSEAYGGVFLAASRLFERVDEMRAAKNSANAWKQLGSRWPIARASESVLPAVSRGASLLPVDLARTVNAMVDTIDGLAVEQPDGSLDMFRGWSTADLLGCRIALHNVETPYGKLSVAIRWHGARPALLWEIAAAPADPVVLRCSVLDPTWSVTQHTGEGLLTAPPSV